MSAYLIVISSPSGGGKTTIIKQLVARHANLCYSISATTRFPRPDEVDGRDYYFLTEREFRDKVKRGEFLEFANVHGFYYGSPKDLIEDRLSQGIYPVLDIDIQGALTIKKNHPKAVLIFIMPPSMKILQLRLKGRGTEDPFTLEKRLSAASEEIKAAQQYDYLVFNEKIDQAISDIECIINHLKK
jgi:guanylate kinase